ncbi:DUF3060 domain-containing protein [Mycolicibacterium sp. XJ1819]
MNPQDDPEERIRQLEQSAATGRAVELGAERSSRPAEPTSALPPPAFDPYQPPFGTQYAPMPSKGVPTGLIFGIIAAFVVITVGVVGFVVWSVTSSSPSSEVVGGGGSFDGPRGQVPIDPPVAVPAETSAPPGGSLSVAGVDGDKTIACNDAAVTVSGVNNTVTLTGHCQSVTVSGMDNHVTVDHADTIGASGFDNQVIYLSGDPQISNSGLNNVVQRG